eukprot:TRINITY_DN30998_c0_g1_i1.p1 TRINITY_DN30998_c0_g1~~TRINITY_DN30998_c0_g1_i1.p1  ORF type:complete len:322 (-),score=30.23 TRINITY_DN30998_c0_g1_i1:91-999(-)
MVVSTLTCSVAPHALCAGCKLVLPNRAFSSGELLRRDDDQRRCKACVGAFACKQCGRVVARSEASAAYQGRQRRAKASSQKCRACALSKGSAVLADSASSPRVAVPRWSIDTTCSPLGGAERYWKWATAISAVLRFLPTEVFARVLWCLDVSSGVAPVAKHTFVCVVCDDILRTTDKQTPSSHRLLASHRRKLTAWRSAVGIAQECVVAAKEAGLLPASACVSACQPFTERINYSEAGAGAAAAVATATDTASPIGVSKAGSHCRGRRRWGRRVEPDTQGYALRQSVITTQLNLNEQWRTYT